MAVTPFAGTYYLAVRPTLPRDLKGSGDYDAHLLRVRRIVIGMMAALLLSQRAWYASVPMLAIHLPRWLPMLRTGILIARMAAAALVARRNSRAAFPSNR